VAAPTLEPRPFSASFSAHLDALRAIAAIWVAASHIRTWNLVAAPVASYLPLAGHDAVIIFFVLSGFLICHAAARTPHLADFAIDRASRLYSVAVPIVLATWLLDGVMARLAPDAYAGYYQLAKPWLYIPLHLGFLGEAWLLRETPASIPPYWSLHYEAWYYVAFAAIVFARGAMRIALLVALGLLLGPKLIVLWPIWLLGAGLYLRRHRLALGRTGARVLVVACVLAYAAIEISGLDMSLWRTGTAVFVASVGFDPGNARHFLSDYILAILVAGLLIGLERAEWPLPPRLARLSRLAAGYSFTLYLLHGPFLLTVRNFIDTTRLTVAGTIAIAVSLGIATILVGEFTEKRLGLWRGMLRSFVGRVSASR